MSASAARSWRTDTGAFWRARPLAATLALPPGVFGPVAKRHGRFASAARRSRSRPSAVRPWRFIRFSRPAMTRFGFGWCGAGAGAFLATWLSPICVSSLSGGRRAGDSLGSACRLPLLSNFEDLEWRLLLFACAGPVGAQRQRRAPELPEQPAGRGAADLHRLGGLRVRRADLELRDAEVGQAQLLDQHALDRVAGDAGRGQPLLQVGLIPPRLDE